MKNCANKRSPFFSVCIPVYNTEKHLRLSIESVLKQTETDFEIILVNDGSADGSGDICDEFAALFPFIHVHHKENEGPLLARHDAVRASSGNYLLFLDSDDLYEPTLLEKMKHTIVETAADMIVFDLKTVSSSGYEAVCSESFENDTCFEGNSKIHFLNYFISHSSLNSMCRKCVRRDVYDICADYSCYKSMIQGEDKLVSIHCLDRAQKIVYVKEPLYIYRENDQGTTHNITLKNYRDIQIVRRELLKYMELWNVSNTAKEQQLTARLISAYNCILSVVFRVFDGKSTIQELKEAVGYIANDEDVLHAYMTNGKNLVGFKKMVLSCVVKRQWFLLMVLGGVFRLRQILIVPE